MIVVVVVSTIFVCFLSGFALEMLVVVSLGVGVPQVRTNMVAHVAALQFLRLVLGADGVEEVVANVSRCFQFVWASRWPWLSRD